MNLMAAPLLVGPYVNNTLQAGNKIFGICEATISFGTIVGAFLWSYLANRITKESCLALASVLAGISYYTLANTHEINYALIAFLILGFSGGSFALIMSLVQMLTDNNYQGRVQATIGAVVTIIFIGFAIILHVFNENYSAQHSYLLLAFLCLFVLIMISLIRYGLSRSNNY